MATETEHLLQEQLTALQALAGVLAAEHDCLLRAAVDQLPACTEQKTAWLSVLQALEQKRLAQWNQDAAAHAPTLWNAVQALAQQVAQANGRNGVMISALMRNTESALHLLCGTAEQPGLYGAHGQGHASTAGPRLLVSA
jgi:flagella synthesis protein FlgN